MRNVRLITLVFGATLLLSGCGAANEAATAPPPTTAGQPPAVLPTSTPQPTAQSQPPSVLQTSTAQATAQSQPTTAVEPGPAWLGISLSDVNTGQAFTLADLRGKVVLVETMAIWCSNCLKQQKQLHALHQELGARDDLATVVLDVDPNEQGEALKSYTAKHGFPWSYAIAPRELASQLAQLYGDQFLNPPSTPMLIVDRQGQVHPLPFGHKDAATLKAALDPFLSS